MGAVIELHERCFTKHQRVIALPEVPIAIQVRSYCNAVCEEDAKGRVGGLAWDSHDSILSLTLSPHARMLESQCVCV